MAIADLVTQFRSIMKGYTPVVHLLEDPDGAPMNQKGAAGAALVTFGLPGSVDTRRIRFDAAADMPADITSNANVLADLVTLDTFNSAARRLQFTWHTTNSWNAAAGAGPIALGAMITVNAADAVAAADRLTYTDLTGAGSSSGGAADVFMVSERSPFLELSLDEAISTVHLCGIFMGFTPTNIVPAFLEVRAI